MKRFILLVLALLLFYPQSAWAISAEQKKVFKQGIGYYDVSPGCTTASSVVVPSTGSSADVSGPADIRKVSPAPFTGTPITPTGVVLHWTAGSPNQSVDSFIAGIKGRGLSVQLFIDGSGNVYQLVDDLATHTDHAGAANNHTIGIEIAAGSDGTVTGAAQEINSNVAQKNAVIKTVSYLVKTYGMQIDPDAAGYKGILSHHLVDPGRKSDVGGLYHGLIVEAVKTGGQAVATNTGSCSSRGISTGGGDPDSNKILGQQMAEAKGFVGAEWACLVDLWTRESGWDHTAINDAQNNNDTNNNHRLDPGETISDAEDDAYGIPQSKPGGKMATAGSDWRTNPATQIKWGLDYIVGRYQTPCKAIDFWNVEGYY